MASAVGGTPWTSSARRREVVFALLNPSLGEDAPCFAAGRRRARAIECEESSDLPLRGPDGVLGNAAVIGEVYPAPRVRLATYSM